MAAHLRPQPGYDAGPEAALLGATAMIDVSDGLISDLGHIATASGVQVNITASSLPIAPAVLKAARALPSAPSAPSARGTTPGGTAASTPGDTAARTPLSTAAKPAESIALDWVLTGGEDHALVAAFPPSVTLPPRWHLIGEVREGSGVTVDNTPHAGPGGWQHFR